MGSYFKPNQRKLVSALAAAIFVAIGIGFCSVPKAFAKYSGGTGEPNNPYRITTPEDLNDIGNHDDDWDKHFILVNDVNLATYTGTQFKIIGNFLGWDHSGNSEGKPFTGVFDGNDHKIWNFTWDSNDIYSVGLFGYLGSNSQVKNLGLENVDVNAVNRMCVSGLVGYNYYGKISSCYTTGSVSGYAYVGGLVGYNYHGTIANCCSSGNISGNARYVGGLAGGNFFSGTITGCYSTGSVTGGGGVGGLVGINSYYGTITNCYSIGGVSGAGCVGGLVGENRGKIRGCYSTGDASGTYYDVGGLVGRNYYATITNCYSTGSVLGVEDIGGLVGHNYPGIIMASFWDIETSGEPNSAGGIGKTTAEMKTRSTFTDAGWDFVEIWGIGENQTYPYLKTTPAGDSNLDNIVDLVDLAILGSHWLEERKSEVRRQK